MINETLEVQNILNGSAVYSDKNLFRVCYLLAKWHKQNGIDPVAARNLIFKWANERGHFIQYNVNSIVRQAFSDEKPLTNDIPVFVSKDDLTQILLRFDKKNVRLVALAMLCYAKAFAAPNKSFHISLAALSEWINVHRGNISARFIPELIAFEYIEKIQNKSAFTWNKTIKAKTLEVKLLVDYENCGEFRLENNNILGLYETLFGGDNIFSNPQKYSSIYGY